MYILWNLRQESSVRFGVLKRQLDGISSKVLTQRLRMLEHEGLIFRDHKPTIPPQVSYGLTKHGTELNSVLGSLETIATSWQNREGLNNKNSA